MVLTSNLRKQIFAPMAYDHINIIRFLMSIFHQTLFSRLLLKIFGCHFLSFYSLIFMREKKCFKLIFKVIKKRRVKCTKQFMRKGDVVSRSTHGYNRDRTMDHKLIVHLSLSYAIVFRISCN